VWTTSTTILRDILKAKASVTAQNLGYEPNVLLVDDLTGAYLASDPTIAAAMAREDRTQPGLHGRFPVIAGLEVITAPTANLPGGTGTKAWVLDTNQLGFIATEDLGGGYQQAGDLVQSKVMRVDENDAWRLRARANFAPRRHRPAGRLRDHGRLMATGEEVIARMRHRSETPEGGNSVDTGSENYFLRVLEPWWALLSPTAPSSNPVRAYSVMPI
jgi:hypothetical protein